MAREEIEKAIENGESVWLAYENRMVLEIGKSKVLKITDDQIKYFNDYYKCEAYGFMNDFFVTKAEAEHYLHHANVTRTETLPFLTWEEFKIKKSLRFKRANDFIFCEMSIFKNQIYIVGYIEKFECFGEATEENFYKAYDECVRLFRSEEL